MPGPFLLPWILFVAGPVAVAVVAGVDPVRSGASGLLAMVGAVAVVDVVDSLQGDSNSSFWPLLGLTLFASLVIAPYVLAFGVI